MSQLLEIFKKQGGLKLIRNYWNNGVLGYALVQFLLLGKSKKSLEILRLGVYFKINQRIKKIYNHVLTDFDLKYNQNKPEMQKSNKVWIYWSTGMEKTAPDVVKKCFKSIQDNLKDREIILLSKQNYKDYVDIPDYIIEKYNKGLIEHVHFADLLRIELLAKHGGTWIDSTVMCINNTVPSYMMNSEFFVFQKLKPGLDGNVINVSSWFISSYSNHKFILAQQALLRHYWKTNNKAIDYFFFHHFMSMVSAFYSEEWKQIIQIPNSLPHILLLMLFDKYDEKKFNAMKEICPFQKLSYKLDETDIAKEGTYYQYIMNCK